MLPREASSGLPKTFEARLYPQLRGDALDPDAPIEFLVPVVDAPLLVIERDSPEARGLQRLLDGGGELQVLIKYAIEVLDAGLPQLRGRATPPVRREPVALDAHAGVGSRPEKQERGPGRVHRCHKIGVEVERWIVARRDHRRGVYAPHSSGPRVFPVGAPIGRHHQRVVIAVERNGGAAMIQERSTVLVWMDLRW